MAVCTKEEIEVGVVMAEAERELEEQNIFNRFYSPIQLSLGIVDQQDAN